MPADTLVALCIPMGLTALLAEAHLRTDLQDAEAPLACSYPATSRLIQPHHVQELSQKGIVVIPAAISPKSIHAARQGIRSLRNSMEASANDADVRQDSIVWIQDQDKDGQGVINVSGEDHLVHCVRLVRGVEHALEEAGYDTPLSHRVPQQCQLAFYPGNRLASYQRHLDTCTSTLYDLGLLEWMRLSDYRQRAITVILYLNEPDRPTVAGGALRCWVDDEDSFDVAPKGGTLVIFQSDKVEHMVLPSLVDRYALTSWVSGRK